MAKKHNYKYAGKPKKGDVVRVNISRTVGLVVSVAQHEHETVLSVLVDGGTILLTADQCERGQVAFHSDR